MGQQTQTAERRKYIRLANKNILHHQRFSLHSMPLDDKFHAVLKNVSAGGCLFESKHRYELGDMLKLEIDLKGWEKFKSEFYRVENASRVHPVVVLASVMRVEMIKPSSLYDIGVCFVGIDEGHRWAVIKYIQNQIQEEKQK